MKNKIFFGVSVLIILTFANEFRKSNATETKQDPAKDEGKISDAELYKVCSDFFVKTTIMHDTAIKDICTCVVSKAKHDTSQLAIKNATKECFVDYSKRANK